MNWQILGAGSQGLLWAARLKQAEIAVQVLQRANAAPLADVLYEHNGVVTTWPIETAQLATAIATEHLLLTVKAVDVEPALLGLMAKSAPPKLVVVLQNGIGAEAIARRLLPEETVIWLGTSTHGSFRRERNHVVHAGVGAIWLGPGRGELMAAEHAQALESLQTSRLNVQWDDGIRTRLWHKLAVNSCINPLTALLNCRNGELLTRPIAQQWLPELAQEAAAVVSAEGYPISTESLLTQVKHVATVTADNYNSMQQDYQHGRTTEIAFITGSLLDAAAQRGLSVPHHEELLTRVQQRLPFGV